MNELAAEIIMITPEPTPTSACNGREPKCAGKIYTQMDIKYRGRASAANQQLSRLLLQGGIILLA